MNTTHTSAQLTKFIELLAQKGVTPDRFKTALGSGILSDVFEPKATFGNRFAVRQALGLGSLPSEPIVLMVDYGQSLEQMIAAGMMVGSPTVASSVFAKSLRPRLLDHWQSLRFDPWNLGPLVHGV